ncbi:hypothetical protein [Sebaldella sp. S0638]|uniref:hypothetical protein n=1 Tax=Sebaldella sp. S0638 TaxID=2957809 RepID=UPI00209D19D6|nr:hypothetical protein [Sebaldella sp. S0638]MCP1224189.1 hypothetical protein [Sebaldella sp. S0638]
MKKKPANKKKTKLTIYIVLRIIVVATMIREIFIQDWHSVFMCVLTLILFLIPSMIKKRLMVQFPTLLESIVVLFIFSAEILGEIHNFYGIFPYWDTMLHTINGFLCAAIGFSLIDILNRSEEFYIKMSPLFVALVAFCFSMTIGVLWEFFEFSADRYLRTDMQKDRIVQIISTVELQPEGKNIPVVIKNIKYTEIYSGNDENNLDKTVIEGGYLDIGLIDTMKDLIVNFVGAFVFSIFGLLYIKNRDKYKFAAKFIPIMYKEKT